MQPQAEIVYLHENGILVTDRRIVTPWQSFAVPHVVSAWGGEDPNGRRIGIGIWALLALGVFLEMAAHAGRPLPTLDAIAIGIVAVFAALVIYIRRRPLPLSVFVATGGGSLIVCSHRDHAFVGRVVRAINHAITCRAGSS